MFVRFTDWIVVSFSRTIKEIVYLYHQLYLLINLIISVPISIAKNIYNSISIEV